MRNKEAVNKEVMVNEKGLRILEIDPWLEPYKGDLEMRMRRYEGVKKELLGENKSFKDFANGHEYFGFHRTNTGWFYREWAPAADALFLIGDFNDWDRTTHEMTKKENGVWEIFIPGKGTLKHQSRVKVHVVHDGQGRDRVPLYVTRAVQDPETNDFSGQIWKPYEITNGKMLISKATSPKNRSSMKRISAWRRKRKPSEPTRNSRKISCQESRSWVTIRSNSWL